PIMEVSLEEISRMEVPIYAMDMAGEPLQDHDFQPAIYVIGKESTGISQELQEITKNCITIPGAGKTESLNAAVAASVLLSQEFFNRIS
ncbi:MAG: TrmH family RNA methyltransferase, partial [Bacteroidota bacterium]